MTTTDVEIASQALLLCRANAISSFSDGTNEADIVTEMYPSFVDDVLSRYPWSWCLKKRRLNRETYTPVNEWKYRYIVPAECLWIHAVYNTDAQGAKPHQMYDMIDGYLYSNDEYVYAEYTYYKSETFWPGYFKQYAIHAFAALICVPVTDDNDRAMQLQRVAYGTPQENEQGGKYAIATNADARQKPPEQIYNNEIIAARFG